MKKLIVLALALCSLAVYAEITAHGVRSVPNGSAVASQPTCDSGVRGLVYNVEGASGAADTLKVCLKDASNNYSWVTK